MCLHNKYPALFVVSCVFGQSAISSTWRRVVSRFILSAWDLFSWHAPLSHCALDLTWWLSWRGQRRYKTEFNPHLRGLQCQLEKQRPEWQRAKHLFMIPNRDAERGIAIAGKTHTHTSVVHHSVLWGWWSWWGFSCNHLPHLVVMATQPEARALGHRGGNGERGRDAGKHGLQSGCLSSLSMRQLTGPGMWGGGECPQCRSSLWNSVRLSHPDLPIWFCDCDRWLLDYYPYYCMIGIRFITQHLYCRLCIQN